MCVRVCVHEHGHVRIYVCVCVRVCVYTCVFVFVSEGCHRHGGWNIPVSTPDVCISQDDDSGRQ